MGLHEGHDIRHFGMSRVWQLTAPQQSSITAVGTTKDIQQYVFSNIRKVYWMRLLTSDDRNNQTQGHREQPPPKTWRSTESIHQVVDFTLNHGTLVFVFVALLHCTTGIEWWCPVSFAKQTQSAQWNQGKTDIASWNVAYRSTQKMSPL